MGAIVGAVQGTWDPNIVDGGPGTVLREANNNDQEALNKLGDEFTFAVRAFTDSAETVDVLNLNNLGVTWPVNSVRNIRCKAWARNKAGTKVAYSEAIIPVIGNGATAAALSVATLAIELGETRFVSRTPLVGISTTVLDTASSTLKFISAVPVITASKVVIRISGGLTAVDLNWLVEVQVGKFRVLTTPIATAGS